MSHATATPTRRHTTTGPQTGRDSGPASTCLNTKPTTTPSQPAATESQSISTPETVDVFVQTRTETRTETTTSSPRLPQTPEPVSDSTRNTTTAISPPDQPKTRLTVPPEIDHLWMCNSSRLFNPDLYFIPRTVHRPTWLTTYSSTEVHIFTYVSPIGTNYHKVAILGRFITTQVQVSPHEWRLLPKTAKKTW